MIMVVLWFNMQQLFVYSVMVKNIKDEIYHQIYIHDKAVGMYM